MENGFCESYEAFCTKLDACSTPLLFCERFDERSNIWNFSKHQHECIELIYFLYGNAQVLAGDTSMQAGFYDTVIYPKNMLHTECLQFNHHQEIICIWVDIPGLELQNVIRIQDKDASLKWLLENLHSEYKSQTTNPLLIDHYIKAAAMLIARRCITQSEPQDMVSRVQLYMQDHMAEELSVGELAQLVYVSKSYLSRVFKEKTGFSIIEYLRLIRIEAAKTMLLSSSMHTEEIAYTIGYHSPKYFYRAFMACTGMSPREFKKLEEKT